MLTNSNAATRFLPFLWIFEQGGETLMMDTQKKQTLYEPVFNIHEVTLKNELSEKMI